MPIITPAFPSMNSSFNVTESTLRLMKSEFKRAHECTKAERWGDLFSEIDFFGRYKVYLQVLLYAGDEDEHRVWFVRFFYFYFFFFFISHSCYYSLIFQKLKK